MKCERCKLEKEDVSMRIFGGMSHNYCNECNELMLSTQGFWTIVIMLIVMGLLALIFL